MNIINEVVMITKDYYRFFFSHSISFLMTSIKCILEVCVSMALQTFDSPESSAGKWRLHVVIFDDFLKNVLSVINHHGFPLQKTLQYFIEVSNIIYFMEAS